MQLTEGRIEEADKESDKFDSIQGDMKMKKLIDAVHGGSRILLIVVIAVIGIAFLVAPVYALGFTQTKLVADQPGAALVTDPNLVNAWGIVIDEEGIIWIADNHSGFVTTYTQDGVPMAVTFQVPPPAESPAGTLASPTGLVANKVRGFSISDGSRSGRSFMIVATEDGTISGWNPFVNTENAILAVDRSASGAVYKGLAIATNKLGTFIYATNFNAGTVDVFDSNWNRVLTFPFTDPSIPAGYAPFGIRAIGDTIFVTYALQDEFKHDDQKGPGHGFINSFTTQGRLISRFASAGVLNSPWGLALAPDRNRFANAGNLNLASLSVAQNNPGRGLRVGLGTLLVGNFGDGRINMFNRNNKAFIGALKDTFGNPIQIDGLWGLASIDEIEPFTLGAQLDKDDVIFFTAGPNGESNGLFGVLKAQ